MPYYLLTGEAEPEEETPRTADEDEYAMFALLADAHPHEVYRAFPDRFWELFQVECPGVTREEMERLLRETESEG